MALLLAIYHLSKLLAQPSLIIYLSIVQGMLHNLFYLVRLLFNVRTVIFYFISVNDYAVYCCCLNIIGIEEQHKFLSDALTHIERKENEILGTAPTDKDGRMATILWRDLETKYSMDLMVNI